MTKMVLTLWIFFALVSATANALQCYDNAVIRCDEHDRIYDDVCAVYDDSATAAREITCNGGTECGTVTVTQSSDGGNLRITLVLQTCLAPTDGCLDREHLERASPEIMRQIEAAESSGVITENLEACSCDTNFCNGLNGPVDMPGSQLRCYENTVITCGDHSAIYNDVCDAYDDSATAPSAVTCSGGTECGKVTVTQSQQRGNFEVTLVLQTCLAPTDGCLDRDELERSSPEIMRQIEAAEASGFTTEKLEACSCDTNFCNNAVNLAGRSVYLLPIIIYTIKLIVLG